MADAVEMIMGLSSHIFVPLFGLVMLVGRCTCATRRLPHAEGEAGAVLGVAAGMDRHVRGHPGHDDLALSVFGQASQELGEERAKGRSTLAAPRGATAHELGDATAVMTAAAVMYFASLLG